MWGVGVHMLKSIGCLLLACPVEKQRRNSENVGKDAQRSAALRSAAQCSAAQRSATQRSERKKRKIFKFFEHSFCRGPQGPRNQNFFQRRTSSLSHSGCQPVPLEHLFWRLPCKGFHAVGGKMFPPFPLECA